MASEATQPALAHETPIEEAAPAPTHEEIQALAHALWQQRGSPEGSPEEDWLAAEQQLRSGTAEESAESVT